MTVAAFGPHVRGRGAVPSADVGGGDVAVAPHRRPCRTRTVVALLTAAALVLSAAACSDDDDSASADRDEPTTSPRPTTTEPVASDTRASRLTRQIEHLLDRYDEVTGQIVATPDISGNRDHRLYRELAQLLVPGTEMTQAVVNALVRRGERGEYQLPVEGQERPVDRRLDGSVDTVSDNEVSFPLCTILQYRDFDQQGRQRRILPGLAEPGRGSAKRVDGEWRLSRLETDDRAACEEER
jgi:hypothetical protein